MNVEVALVSSIAVRATVDYRRPLIMVWVGDSRFRLILYHARELPTSNFELTSPNQPLRRIFASLYLVAPETQTHSGPARSVQQPVQYSLPRLLFCLGFEAAAQRQRSNGNEHGANEMVGRYSKDRILQQSWHHARCPPPPQHFPPRTGGKAVKNQ